MYLCCIRRLARYVCGKPEATSLDTDEMWFVFPYRYTALLHAEACGCAGRITAPPLSGVGLTFYIV